MEKFLVEILLVTVLFGALTHAVYVDPPERITLLPESAQLVFNAIYKTAIYADNSIVFDAENSCKDQQLRALQAALLQSGNNSHSCYSLSDDHVARFMAIANETQLLQQFQQDVDKCPARNSQFYEFNCYVSVVQTYLQKIYSYVHKPNNSFEWNLQYQLALSRYRKLALCTGGELRSLMQQATVLIDAFALC